MSNNDAQSGTGDAYTDSQHTKKSPYRAWMMFALLAGVLLPTAAVLVEVTTRICSSLFDPIPTVWHIALWMVIPVSNLAAIWSCTRGRIRYPGVLVLLLGASLGTSAALSIQFLPLFPYSVIGILALGLGLCGLSPYLALWSSVVCSMRIKELQLVDERRSNKLLWYGGITAVAVLAAYATTVAITTKGMAMAASPDEAVSRSGVRMVRRFGSDRLLLRACYELPINVMPDFAIVGMRTEPGKREQARETYYRVTGRQFNSVPPPQLFGNRSAWTEDFDIDSDVGGSAVNSVVKNLSLVSSRIDATAEPDALTSYTEWTLTFKNSSAQPKEARSELALPPGGVVSRLTLWVNGEPREAAWSTRGKVRAAYQDVAVVQQRDPVLVTSCGPDRILMQCFPVPANGGTMKVRVGITAPLRINKTPGSSIDHVALLHLPRFMERNFSIPLGIRHSVSIRSPRGVRRDGPTEEGWLDSGPTSLRKLMSDEDLKAQRQAIICERDLMVRRVWTQDRTDPKNFAIVQEVVADDTPKPRAVVIVVDDQTALRKARREIAAALDNLPPGTEFCVLGAADSVTELTPMQPATKDSISAAQEKIRRLPCSGGIDSRAALIEAWDIAERHDGSVVLWIHGPQPLKSESQAEQLLQRSENPGNVRTICAAAADGRNTVLADLESTGTVEVFPTGSSVGSGLRRLFSQWNPDGPRTLVTRRHRVPATETGSAAHASAHIARLWANDEVRRICRTGDSRRLPEASELAARHQLVTPVSGAVVLETERQYEAAGLEPADPGSVPSTVPEPSAIATLAMGSLSLALMYRRSRRQNRQPVEER